MVVFTLSISTPTRYTVDASSYRMNVAPEFKF